MMALIHIVTIIVILYIMNNIEYDGIDSYRDNYCNTVKLHFSNLTLTKCNREMELNFCT